MNTNVLMAIATSNCAYVMGATVAAEARVVAMKINAWAADAETATIAQRRMTLQCGHPISKLGMPDTWPNRAATNKKGTASAATMNCVASNEALPATR